ncbi:MAG TPA: hypothetical protein DDZ51_03505, partial [Planctomycetaceae bacterium]|nr:hypothetical protein [Planctomycetaceae bacterium]
MPKMQLPKSNSRYYYRYVHAGGKRKRVYVGKVTDPAVQVVMRNDQLQAAEEKAATERFKLQQKRCKQVKMVWAHLTQILGLWETIELGRVPRSSKSKAAPTSPNSLTSPYPWQGNLPERFQQIRFLLSERVIAPGQSDRLVEQLVEAEPDDNAAELRELGQFIDYKRKVFVAGVDLLSICRDFLIVSIAGDCPVTQAVIEAAITELNRNNGFAAAKPMEQLLIEALSLTYFESLAFSALSFSENHGPTHAQVFSDTANQAARRFVALSEMLEGYRNHPARLAEQASSEQDLSEAELSEQEVSQSDASVPQPEVS